MKMLNARPMLPSSIELLERIVAFPTVSHASNLDLARFIAAYLATNGVEAELFFNDAGTKASLHATIGTDTRSGGVLLSGHMDVVPADGHGWASDPFRLHHRSGRLFGRGTADMKGFLASVLACVPKMVEARLKCPIHLAFSYDEELGCLGVRPMLDRLRERGVRPNICIVGEPTEMRVATAHKGKTTAHCECTGQPAHSALAPSGLNAIHLATEMIDAVRELQRMLAATGARDGAYSVPFTTAHVGMIAGGTALNIVPSHCRFAFEIRNLPDDDPPGLIEQLRQRAGVLVARHEAQFPAAAIDLQVINTYPALETSNDLEAINLVQALAATGATTKVAFGTEGGLFHQALGVPVVVCGPGSMEQGHKVNEFIEVSQLAQCNAFLERLIASLA